MKGPENRFIDSVHRLLKGKCHFEKMHNMYRGGTADCWYSGPAGDLWIEYKWLDRVPVRKCTPALEPLQREWLRGRDKEGRSVLVLVGCPAGGIAFRETKEWEEGRAVSPTIIMSKSQIADAILENVGEYPETTNEKGSKRSTGRTNAGSRRVQSRSNGIPAVRVDKVSTKEKSC